MRVFEDSCVGCEQCINCGRKEPVEVFYCDECGRCEPLYHYEGRELCQECIISSLDIVEGSD